MKKQNRANKILAQRAIEIQAQLEQMKPLYREMDEVLAAISKEGPIDTGSEIVMVKDCFAAKNTVFKTTAVKRFELVVHDANKTKEKK